MDYYYKLKHGDEYWYISLINGDVIVIDRDIEDFASIKEYEEKYQMYFPFDFEFIDDKFKITFRHMHSYILFDGKDIVDSNCKTNIIPNNWKDYKDLIIKLIHNLIISPTVIYRDTSFYCGNEKMIFKLKSLPNNEYTLISNGVYTISEFFESIGLKRDDFPTLKLADLKLYIQFLNCNFTCQTSLVINDNDIVIDGKSYPIKSKRGKFYCVIDIRTLINKLSISTHYFFTVIGRRVGVFPQFNSKEKLKDTIKKLSKRI